MREVRAKKHEILREVFLTEYTSVVKPWQICHGLLLPREEAPRDAFLELLDAQLPAHLFFMKVYVASFAFGFLSHQIHPAVSIYR